MNQIDMLLNIMNNLEQNPTVLNGLNTPITKHLGLLDEEGRGLQEATIDLSTNKASWTIPALTTPIKATAFLTKENKALDAISFKFIVIRLQIRPISGTNWEDAVFKREDLEAITSHITSIKPFLAIATHHVIGFAVTGGGFTFHFKNKNMQQLDKDYYVILKTYTEKDIISDKVNILAKAMKLEDVDVIDNLKINFAIGKQGPTEGTIEAGIFVNINNVNKVGKQFNSLNKMLPSFIKVKVKAVNIKSKDRIWGAGDSVVLQYINVFTLDAETILKL